VAEIPADEYEFLNLLKMFANLLFALFRSVCPLYLKVKQMIKALNAYKKNAFKAISYDTQAAILWILLLLTWHFVPGHVATLAEFKVMVDKLTAQDSHIQHAEVPMKFTMQNSYKRQKIDIPPGHATPAADRDKEPTEPKHRQPLLTQSSNRQSRIISYR